MSPDLGSYQLSELYKDLIKTVPSLGADTTKEARMKTLPLEKTLTEIRLSLGFTHREIGEKLGTRTNNIQQIEARKNWRVETLSQYLEAIGCKLVLEVEMPDKKRYGIASSAVTLQDKIETLSRERREMVQKRVDELVAEQTTQW